MTVLVVTKEEGDFSSCVAASGAHLPGLGLQDLFQWLHQRLRLREWIGRAGMLSGVMRVSAEPLRTVANWNRRIDLD